jgi:hypothetical protein
MSNIAGPCVVCGGTDYSLSCGGPTICPKCDCGQFDAATVLQQAKVIERLRQRVAVLEMVIREELFSNECTDDANAMIVEEVHDKMSPDSSGVRKAES